MCEVAMTVQVGTYRSCTSTVVEVGVVLNGNTPVLGGNGGYRA